VHASRVQEICAQILCSLLVQFKQQNIQASGAGNVRDDNVPVMSASPATLLLSWMSECE